MHGIAKTGKNGVKAAENQTITSPRSAAPNSFRKSFESLFGAKSSQTQVNEEEVFASVIGKLIGDQLGSGAAARYKENFNSNLQAIQESGKHSATERAARKTLREFYENGDLSEGEIQQMRETGFYASQLDKNYGKLYDSIGGPGDPTKAVASFATASKMVAKQLTDVQSTGVIPSRRRA